MNKLLLIGITIISLNATSYKDTYHNESWSQRTGKTSDYEKKQEERKEKYKYEKYMKDREKLYSYEYNNKKEVVREINKNEKEKELSEPFRISGKLKYLPNLINEKYISINIRGYKILLNNYEKENIIEEARNKNKLEFICYKQKDISYTKFLFDCQYNIIYE